MAGFNSGQENSMGPTAWEQAYGTFGLAWQLGTHTFVILQ